MPFRGTTQHRREREREEQDQDQEEGSARWRRRRDGQGKKEAIDGKKGKENGGKKRKRERERDDQECTAGRLTIGGRNVAGTDDVFGNTRRLFTLNTERHPPSLRRVTSSTLSIP